MPRSGSYLGPSLGSRDPEHIARWAAALKAGLAKRRCTAVARTTGKPCRQVALKFADKCAIHCRGAERIEVDRLRLVWLRRKLRCHFFNVHQRALLEARVARIERRRLRWVWKADPTVEGSTIALQAGDVERVQAWLSEVARIDFGGLTARAYDRCLWAGALVLSRRYDEARALVEVRRALRDEERWRTKTFAAA